MPGQKLTLDQIGRVFAWVFGFMALMLVVRWAVPSVDYFGIQPRTLWGLVGIVGAPFLHGNWAHLFANASALFVLGILLMALEGRTALPVVLTVMLFGGFGTWLIGKSGSVHIGASGLVYGLIGYLIASAWFRRTPGYLLAGVLVLFLYGGAVWGVLPTDPHISWEGHLCGGLAGVLDAKFRAQDLKAA